MCSEPMAQGQTEGQQVHSHEELAAHQDGKRLSALGAPVLMRELDHTDHEHDHHEPHEE